MSFVLPERVTKPISIGLSRHRPEHPIEAIRSSIAACALDTMAEQIEIGRLRAEMTRYDGARHPGTSGGVTAKGRRLSSGFVQLTNQ